ncbi:aminotransferase class III-fold pyridoxal phosphate-dependent enzyme, partial [Schumannella luteola]
EKLAEITPGDFEKHTILVNSGAEAVENAVKIARRFTGRRAIVSLDHAFHGRTNLTMAMTYRPWPERAGMG